MQNDVVGIKENVQKSCQPSPPFLFATSCYQAHIHLLTLLPMGEAAFWPTPSDWKPEH